MQLLGRKVAADEDNPAAPVVIGPGIKRYRGMEDVLNAVDHDGSGFADDVDETFDAQEGCGVFDIGNQLVAPELIKTNISYNY